MNSRDQMKRDLEKIVLVLKDKDNYPSPFIVIGAYKRKAQKVYLVDANNKTREGPRGYPDQFTRSKAREYSQE